MKTIQLLRAWSRGGVSGGGRRGAGLLRALAGLPAGCRRTRRGTVLVLILGALALIAVLTIVYVAVGQSDRRVGEQIKQSGDVQTAIMKIADYMVETIGNSTVTLAVDGQQAAAGGGGNVPILYHPFMDYPWTDPYRRSISTTGGWSSTGVAFHERFGPTGSYDDLWAGTGNVDLRMPCTPWLSFTVPSVDATATTLAPEDPSRWDHITNFAPDGRFVNLWNLAPVVGNVRRSAWDARSGFDPSAAVPAPVFNASNELESYLSYGLTLLDTAGNPTSPAALPDGTPADPNVPAHWDTYQTQLFRPARGPMFYPGSPAANSPLSELYALYQYADADGDGFLDSRWFELVDASDWKNVRALLPQDDRYRWFAAAKVVDLNSLVNVNTAQDQKHPARLAQAAQGTLPPGSTWPQVMPMGMGPEVDFARMLRFVDVDQFPPPATPSGFFGYGNMLQPTTPGADDYTNYDLAAADKVGSAAYATLRYVLAPNSVNVPDPATATIPVGFLSADARERYYRTVGSQASGGFVDGTARVSGNVEVNARFGMSDLLELFTFRTENNPQTVSRLEQVLDGRDTSSAANMDFGPLRSNRGPQWESYTAAPLTDGTADAMGMARAKYDLRQYLTPYNGGRELVPTVLVDGTTGLADGRAKSVITNAELSRVNAVDALKAAIAYNNVNATLDGKAIDRDPSKLFEGYARALLPHAAEKDAWNPAATPNLRTLAYGNSPERALRTAAALTLNLIDSADKDHEPSKVTLLIDASFRNTVGTQAGGPNSALLFPWWTEPGHAATTNPTVPATWPGRLDLGNNSLANKGGGTTDVVGARAVNLYGIEAQPIISEAASFYLYTDAPLAAGGDSDFAATGAQPPITINGKVSVSEARPNADFLGAVIVFQLTNPFDTDIPLTDAAAAAGSTTSAADPRDSDYYIEFAGLYYKLADWDHTANVLKPVVLHAGETRTFYVLSHPKHDDSTDSMKQRWVNIDSTLGALTGQDIVDRFIDHQLGVEKYSSSVPDTDLIRGSDRMRPVQILPMKDDGSVITTAINPIPAAASGGAVPKKSVHLWRTLRSQAEPQDVANNRLNDLLADRLRDPDTRTSTSTLDRSFSAASNNVVGTTSGPEGTADNTGYTIVLWADMKRRDDPGATAGIPRGAIPAYCVEAKWGSTALKNVKSTDGATPPPLQSGDFVGRGANFGKTFRTTIDRLAPPPMAESDTTLILSLCHRAEKKASNSIGANLDARQYKDLYPEIYLDDNRFEKTQPPFPPATASTKVSILRVTDMLLPLGICPSYDPLADPEVGGTRASSEGQSDEHAGRVTLTEALGIALNYSAPTTISGANDPYAVFAASTTTSPIKGIGDRAIGSLDRGNLVLDRVNLAARVTPDLFVPYEDVNANGTFDAGTDRVRFPHIPLAMHVLDVFTTAPATLAGANVPGLVNVNTMPRPVASVLGMLTPTPETNAWNQWLTDALGTAPPATNGPLPTTQWDVAAALLAYRDRTVMVDRMGRKVRFDDTSAAANLFNPAQWDGRALTTAIPGLRQAPGFASRAEILAAYDRAGNTLPFATRVPVEDQIDYLGRDLNGANGVDSGYLGTNTSSYKDSATLPATPKPDTIPNNYAEKLILASGVMNSITTRSDVFAVWFVVHGYQKSDTEGLHPLYVGDTTPPDPLVPSIAKRFLMVVDRSNVTRLGQKPKVLLFTEVPMTNQQANQ